MEASSWIRRAVASPSILTGVNPVAFSTSDPLRLFIIQAFLIIVLSRLLGLVLRKLNQPAVISEVIGGIILGPTVMGRIPHFTTHILPTASIPYLTLVANIGLVLFLFMVGLEVDPRIVRQGWKQSLAVSAAGLVVPFALGIAVAKGLYDTFVDQSAVTFGHFLLFVGVAMSITAFPVLARILTETKLLYTKVGALVLAAGVGNDVVGWILLALTIALLNATSGVVAVYILLVSVGWCLFIFFLVRPAFIWLARRTGSFEHGPSQFMVAVTLLLVLASAWFTDVIGVHPIFGAFIVGLMVPHEGGYAVAMTEKIEDFVSTILLPLYFALSGLNTNLGDLNTGLIWGYTIAIIVVAFASKFISCTAAAKLCKFSWRESAAMGTLMSCKGLVELIVLNIGLSAGVLDTRTFSMFVLMALITTFLTTPLVLWIYPERHRTAAPAFVQDNATRVEVPGNQGAQGVSQGQSVMVVLTGFEYLPSLMGLIQLLRPACPQAAETPSWKGRNQLRKRNKLSPSDSQDACTEESASHHGGSTSDVEEKDASRRGSLASAAQQSLQLNALRLVELSDRTSAVMRVAETEETLRFDPVTNIFKTFAQLNRFVVRAAMNVVSVEQFSPTIVERARAFESDLVILPWTLPVVPRPTNTSSTGGQAETQFQFGLVSASSGPFDNMLGRTVNAGTDTFRQSTASYTALARKLTQDAECNVGLLIDRSIALAGASHPAGRIKGGVPGRILVAFMGGPDDRAALQLVTKLCHVSQGLSAIVLRFVRETTEASSRDGKAGDALAGGSAAFEDDVTIRSVTDGDALGECMAVKTLRTANPLRDLILAVEEEQPSLVVVGRGRQTSTIGSHRDELLNLLKSGSPSLALSTSAEASQSKESPSSPTMGPLSPSLSQSTALAPLASPVPPSGTLSASSTMATASKLVDSEPCKVVGEVALALSLTQSCTANTLVISSMSGRRFDTIAEAPTGAAAVTSGLEGQSLRTIFSATGSGSGGSRGGNAPDANLDQPPRDASQAA